MGPRNPRKTWFLTYPKNESSTGTLLEGLTKIDTIIEYVIAKETHKDGSSHLHAYVKYDTGVTLKDCTTVFNCIGKSGNYQPARSPKAVIAYCTKEDDYISNINIKSYLGKKGKVTSDTLRVYSAIEALDRGIIGINSLKNYEFGRSLAIQPKERPGVCGIWLYGVPGVGKSHHARQRAGDDLYIKLQNKWWDGYAGQSFVLIDDLDREFKSWHNLKLWTDKWKTTGEIKGGMVALVYDEFIITSNYRLSELVNAEEDPQLYEALSRRFTQHEIKNEFSTDPTLKVTSGEWNVVIEPPLPK